MGQAQQPIFPKHLRTNSSNRHRACVKHNPDRYCPEARSNTGPSCPATGPHTAGSYWSWRSTSGLGFASSGLNANAGTSTGCSSANGGSNSSARPLAATVPPLRAVWTCKVTVCSSSKPKKTHDPGIQASTGGKPPSPGLTKHQTCRWPASI